MKQNPKYANYSVSGNFTFSGQLSKLYEFLQTFNRPVNSFHLGICINNTLLKSLHKLYLLVLFHKYFSRTTFYNGVNCAWKMI